MTPVSMAGLASVGVAKGTVIRVGLIDSTARSTGATGLAIVAERKEPTSKTVVVKTVDRMFMTESSPNCVLFKSVIYVGCICWMMQKSPGERGCLLYLQGLVRLPFRAF